MRKIEKLLLLAIVLVITALLVKSAYIERGYFGIGGEWIWWMVLLLPRLAGERRMSWNTTMRAKLSGTLYCTRKGRWCLYNNLDTGACMKTRPCELPDVIGNQEHCSQYRISCPAAQGDKCTLLIGCPLKKGERL